MLKYLQIENIAVIETAEIYFDTGFHAMTGETGAGKSIIIDSLYAVLGERTSRELIRRGCKQAGVTACFVNLPQVVYQKLGEYGIEVDPNEELIIKRVISDDGHGKVRINMQPATVAVLKEIGRYLITLHGQFDNQSLLTPEKHIDFVDAYAKNDALKQKYRENFERLKGYSKELNTLLADEAETRKNYDLLRYQIDEIENIDIKPGEIAKLREIIRTQQNAESITQQLQNAAAALCGDGNEESSTVKDLLQTAVKSTENATKVFEAAKPLNHKLAALLYDVEDIGAELNDLISANRFDAKLLENSQKRLDDLLDILHKYGNDETAVLNFLASAKEKINAIKMGNRRQTELQELLKSAEKDLVASGQALTNSRKNAANEIAQKVSAELKYLDFKSAEFTFRLSNGKYTKNGCDSLEFLICANLGEQAKPLAKVASGGELSRVMLAIRSVLSEGDSVETFVFDEIDAGISGHAAVKVGNKLKQVANSKQVICVTHLAQIASQADKHMLIQKSEKDGRTFTEVLPLDGETRVREIARIMAGDNDSETILASARELLNN